ncbi:MULTISPECIES: hypothetical protein [Bacillaceae]|uniref:Uncharacterized protein n=1 Tax=Domibacillus aminovorans TaxID=29332 RepID=A0A177KJ71_9BACI|nr:MULTISPECIES: hypothetical protein [Bacillaceae]OAH52925.1 hypothetical protein AWH48_14065 [Domibacillus aminovorans]
MSMEDVVSIGANCLVEIKNRFFLLVEIEVEAGNVEIEEFVFIELSKREAKAVSRAGVEPCTIKSCIPRSDDLEVEFICILIVDGKAFEVFDVENDTDEAVLVKISLEKARDRIRQGARRCTVIERLSH